MTDWVILRCAGSSTLQLASSLSEAGYECWTPAVLKQEHVGPSRTRKRIMIPLIKRYVFARQHHRLELLALSRSPALCYRKWDAEKRRMVTCGIPKFDLLRDANGFCGVTDRELSPLRLEERRGAPKEKAREFRPGESVKAIDGPWQGLSGRVSSVSGIFVSVEFPGSNIVPKIATWYLQHSDAAMMEKAA